MLSDSPALDVFTVAIIMIAMIIAFLLNALHVY
jgi:hypothetical protein